MKGFNMNNLALSELLASVATELERLDFEENAIALTDAEYIELLHNRITLAGLGMVASRFAAPAQALCVSSITGAINDLDALVGDLDHDGEFFEGLMARINAAQGMGEALLALND